MRGGDGQPLQLAKFFEQRHGQRRAFFRRRAGAHLIDQNQRPIRRGLQHRFQIHHVRRKSREVGGDGLLVADVGQHLIEHRHLGAIGGHWNSGLRGKRSQADRFQRHGLAAGVRPADYHHRFVAAERQR